MKARNRNPYGKIFGEAHPAINCNPDYFQPDYFLAHPAIAG